MFKRLTAILCLSKYQLFIKQKNVSSSNVFAFDKGYAHHFFKLHSFRFEQTSHLKFLRLNSAKKQSFKFSWLAYSMLFIVSIFALLEIMKERMKKMSCVFNDLAVLSNFYFDYSGGIFRYSFFKLTIINLCRLPCYI